MWYFYLFLGQTVTSPFAMGLELCGGWDCEGGIIVKGEIIEKINC